MDLSIITVTYNAEELIAQQIKSVFKGIDDLNFEQIIVDNNSTDKTIEIIERDFLEVKLIKNKQNFGFGYANNQGFKISQGKFLLFLNPDMLVEENILKKIMIWLVENPQAGIVGCRLTDNQGQIKKDAMPRRFPTALNQLAIIFKLPHFFPNILNNYLYHDVDWTKTQEVDSVRGSFLLIRREICEKLGWAFDPRYFIWFEDVDLCREVKRLGYSVIYNPMISCVDFLGQTFKKQDVFWKQKNITRSMNQYFKKWHPWYEWMWISLAHKLVLTVVVLRNKKL
jgi:hypothetical protein